MHYIEILFSKPLIYDCSNCVFKYIGKNLNYKNIVWHFFSEIC